jgi:hypothetical protein
VKPKAANNPEAQAFWEAARRSAERTRGLPLWTQAGIALSDNFEGGVATRESQDAADTSKKEHQAR